MSEKIKVLYFVDRMLRGGIQSLVIDWISRFDKTKIQVDFLLLDDGNIYEEEKLLEKYGCNVYKLNGIWIRKPLDYLKYSKAANAFFKYHNDYDVVHLHSSSKNYFILKYAKKYGIKNRVAHSHNINFQTKNKIKIIVGNILKYKLKTFATDYFACSKIAGEWLFGKKTVLKNKFRVIHNSIDYEKFKYNEKNRYEIRSKYNLKDCEILIGHVGRFTEQKNHQFLIKIFNELLKMNSNYRLLMIGTGEKEDYIKKMVGDYNIKDKVIFAGFQKDVNLYMQAMDIFLMPSKHEGLPVAGIEAQAAGLPVFTSEKVVTDELKITDLIKYISLKLDEKEWATIINNSKINRINTKNDFKREKYLIEDTIKELENFYISCKRER